MNKYEIYQVGDGYLINIEDEFTVYDFYDVPKQIIDIIKQLEQENKQLKEQRKELRSWLEEALNELKQNDIYDRTSYEMGQVIATECIIEKLNELEGGKNE